ncbi:hypothetical protein [Halostagnicola sp. A-GB9-2]|uniref:hypothetical protein n=1 Tax=Halostagnicola sp. A-GB9-2 TaxID=3048066 RepID=UPI0024BF4A00|nr:hypothetical protein [Halostagnicola sp. A-GB9-2]MDJ1434162.1 hypothetical protein [Halostagnicola sp. A-GB9-2]
MTNDTEHTATPSERPTTTTESTTDEPQPAGDLREATEGRPPFDPRLAEITGKPGSSDQSRSPNGVQSPTSAIAPTAESGFGLPLERRHVIASALAALGIASVGSAQARHGNNGQGNGQGQGRGQGDIDVKRGIVSHESPGAADDGTWNTYEVDQQSVNFEDSFEAPPIVFIGSTSYTTIGIFRAIDVTEHGFESRWMVYQSNSFAAPDAQWVAVGLS